jgi:hypothetical protein
VVLFANPGEVGRIVMGGVHLPLEHPGQFAVAVALLPIQDGLAASRAKIARYRSER